MIISFIIFNKKTIKLFNLDIDSVLRFLVLSVKMFDFFCFFGKKTKITIIYLFLCYEFKIVIVSNQWFHIIVSKRITVKKKLLRQIILLQFGRL